MGTTLSTFGRSRGVIGSELVCRLMLRDQLLENQPAPFRACRPGNDGPVRTRAGSLWQMKWQREGALRTLARLTPEGAIEQDEQIRGRERVFHSIPRENISQSSRTPAVGDVGDSTTVRLAHPHKVAGKLLQPVGGDGTTEG